MNAHLSGPRVAYDIGQRFLKYSEKRRVEFLCQRRVAQVRMNFTFDAGSVLEFIGLPFKRGRQAEMIQNSRAQFT